MIDARLERDGAIRESRSAVLTRRNVLVTSAWAVPTIAVASATPAFAASGDGWTISSSSWEGNSGGGRSNSADYFFRFTITVTGTVATPQCVWQLNPVDSPTNSNGAVVAGITTAAPTATIGGWSCTGSGALALDSANAFRQFTFTLGSLSAGVHTLNFNASGVGADDLAGTGNKLTFTSGTSEAQPHVFTVLAVNTPSATDPAGLITTGPVVG